MAWRVQWRVGSASAAHRRECESANGDHEASSERKLLLQLLLSSPLMRLTLHVESFCGAIAAASAPAPEAAAGFAAPRDGCAAAALLAARLDRLVARLHRAVY